MSNKKKKNNRYKSLMKFCDDGKFFTPEPYDDVFRKSIEDVILQNQLNGQKEALIYAIDCNNKQNAQYEKEIRKINEQLMSLEKNKIKVGGIK